MAPVRHPYTPARPRPSLLPTMIAGAGVGLAVAASFLTVILFIAGAF